MAHPLPHPTEPEASRDRRPEFTLLPAYGEVRESLIRTLALDRLRDLRDDGVTRNYMGRMYGVSGECMERLEGELREPGSMA